MTKDVGVDIIIQNGSVSSTIKSSSSENTTLLKDKEGIVAIIFCY